MSLPAHEPIPTAAHRESRRFDLSQALVEARRCLRCYDAPCSAACPAHIDVPGFISRLAEQDVDGSYRVIASANPLPAICGLACPTQDLCEGACLLDRQNQPPIRVGALQHFVAAHYQTSAPVENTASARSVAVIGAGPSGLSCAAELRRLGEEVTVYDRALTPGGLADQVIPAWRLPQDCVDHELTRLCEQGILFRMGEEIDAVRAAELRNSYDALYVAVGMSRSASLDIPGSDLPGVSPALDLLHMARRSQRGECVPPSVGECVVVVGGGNVALDAAVAAMRLGAARAIVLYRRTLAEMPAWHSEYVEAAALGVEFRWLSVARSIRSSQNHGLVVDVQSMKLGAAGSDGRRRVAPDTSAQAYELPCDAVLVAVGQTLEPDITGELGLDLTSSGCIRVDSATGETTQPGIFAGGDAVNGGATVVQAVADGVRTARAIHARLTDKGGR